MCEIRYRTHANTFLNLKLVKVQQLEGGTAVVPTAAPSQLEGPLMAQLLQPIGFWVVQTDPEDERPHPRDLVDVAWADANAEFIRATLIPYLR